MKAPVLYLNLTMKAPVQTQDDLAYQLMKFKLQKSMTVLKTVLC